jgi:hypothetical protein
MIAPRRQFIELCSQKGPQPLLLDNARLFIDRLHTHNFTAFLNISLLLYIVVSQRKSYASHRVDSALSVHGYHVVTSWNTCIQISLRNCWGWMDYHVGKHLINYLFILFWFCFSSFTCESWNIQGCSNTSGKKIPHIFFFFWMLKIPIEFNFKVTPNFTTKYNSICSQVSTVLQWCHFVTNKPKYIVYDYYIIPLRSKYFSGN